MSTRDNFNAAILLLNCLQFILYISCMLACCCNVGIFEINEDKYDKLSKSQVITNLHDFVYTHLVI